MDEKDLEEIVVYKKFHNLPEIDGFYIDMSKFFEGSIGDEIVEVETARKEEREKADVEKKANAQKMIEDNFSAEMIERYTGLSIERIKQLQVSTKNRM